MSLENMTDDELIEYQQRMANCGSKPASPATIAATIVGAVFVGGTLFNLIDRLSIFDFTFLAIGGAALYYANKHEQRRRHYKGLEQEARLERQRRR